MNNILTIDFSEIAKNKASNLFAGQKNGKALLKKSYSIFRKPKQVSFLLDEKNVVSSSFYFGILYPIFKGKSYEYICNNVYYNEQLFHKNKNLELERAIQRVIQRVMVSRITWFN